MTDADDDERRPASPPLSLAEVAEILASDRVGLFLASGDRLPNVASEAWPGPTHFNPVALDLCERVWLSREVGIVVDRAARRGFMAAPLLLGTQLFGVLLAARGAGRPAATIALAPASEAPSNPGRCPRARAGVVS